MDIFTLDAKGLVINDITSTTRIPFDGTWYFANDEGRGTSESGTLGPLSWTAERIHFLCPQSGIEIDMQRPCIDKGFSKCLTTWRNQASLLKALIPLVPGPFHFVYNRAPTSFAFSQTLHSISEVARAIAPHNPSEIMLLNNCAYFNHNALLTQQEIQMHFPHAKWLDFDGGVGFQHAERLLRHGRALTIDELVSDVQPLNPQSLCIESACLFIASDE
jgi:hypothetical protein